MASSDPEVNSVKSAKNNSAKDEPAWKTWQQTIINLLLLLLFGLILHCFIVSHVFSSDDTDTPQEEVDTIAKLIKDSWKHPNLLNLSDFKWVRNNVSVCSKNPPEKLLLILVNSARDNYHERAAVRKAVLKMTEIVTSPTKWGVRVVFLLGGSFNPDGSDEFDSLLMEEAFLDEEQSVYGDLVIGNFVDTSENLTYKTLMGFKWALTHCADADFIVKMDDDVFFNIPKFVEYRNADLNLTDVSKIPNLYCIPEIGRKPLRIAKEDSFDQMKFLVTKEEWAADEFPNYCKGLLYGMTPDLVKSVYDASGVLDYFRMEDVFITGVVLNQVNSSGVETVVPRNLEVGLESEDKLPKVCEKKVMRQTVSQEIGIAIELKRTTDIEQQMLCLVKEVTPS